MKLSTTIACGIIMMALHANATTYNLSNGNFGNQISGMSLANGDVIEIPSGFNVTFSSSQTITQEVIINIKGTFNMAAGENILTMSCGGVANVYPGGTVSGTDASQNIIICGNNVFTGASPITSTSTTLTATSTSQGFMSISPLPLQFISFDAQVKSPGVSLNWTAKNDGPTTMFAVQQSLDGRSWDEVATVKATGSDHETVAYTYDVKATKTGTALYRIHYIGSNPSEVVYSPTRLVNVAGSANQTIAVIAADAHHMQIGLSAVEGRGATTVIISAMDGRVVYSGQYAPESRSFSIPLSSAGVFAVTITDGNSFRITQKVAAL